MKKLAAMIALLLTCACTSAPPSRERPQVACWFDEQRRFDYVLVIERDATSARFGKRTVLTAAPNHADTEERTAPTELVRPGHCPDEATYFIEGRSPWAQPKGEQ